MTAFYESEPQPGQDPLFDSALHAIGYRDAETASQTFNMLEAIDLILAACKNGSDLDYERLGRLVAALEPGPRPYTRMEDDGTLVYYDEEGNEIKRVEPSPAVVEYYKMERARKEALEAHVKATAPRYIDDLLEQLASPDT